MLRNPLHIAFLVLSSTALVGCATSRNQDHPTPQKSEQILPGYYLVIDDKPIGYSSSSPGTLVGGQIDMGPMLRNKKVFDLTQLRRCEFITYSKIENVRLGKSAIIYRC